MQIRRVQHLELPAVLELLVTNGWSHRINDIDQLGALVEASQVANVAIICDQIVGFSRGITDGLSNGYLSMVVVAPSHRSKGIGRQLVEHSTKGNSNVTWVLRAGRAGAVEFFTKLGFERSSIALERQRA